MQKFLKKVKNMDIVKMKEMTTLQINLASNITQQQQNQDYLDVYLMEQKCV